MFLYVNVSQARMNNTISAELTYICQLIQVINKDCAVEKQRAGSKRKAKCEDATSQLSQEFWHC